MNTLTTVGIDLAKSGFSLHGVEVLGKTVLPETGSRPKLPQLNECPARPHRYARAALSTEGPGENIQTQAHSAKYANENDGAHFVLQMIDGFECGPVAGACESITLEYEMDAIEVRDDGDERKAQFDMQQGRGRDAGQ